MNSKKTYSIYLSDENLFIVCFRCHYFFLVPSFKLLTWNRLFSFQKVLAKIRIHTRTVRSSCNLSASLGPVLLCYLNFCHLFIINSALNYKHEFFIPPKIHRHSFKLFMSKKKMRESYKAVKIQTTKAILNL